MRCDVRNNMKCNLPQSDRGWSAYFPQVQAACATRHDHARGAHLSVIALSLALLFCGAGVHAAELPAITNVDWQPFTAQIKRIVEATDYLGSPFTAPEKDEISRLF